MKKLISVLLVLLLQLLSCFNIEYYFLLNVFQTTYCNDFIFGKAILSQIFTQIIPAFHIHTFPNLFLYFLYKGT